MSKLPVIRVVLIYSVSGMAHFLLVKVQSRVVTAKCSEPQAFSSNAKGGVSGVAKLLGLRIET